MSSGSNLSHESNVISRRVSSFVGSRRKFSSSFNIGVRTNEAIVRKKRESFWEMNRNTLLAYKPEEDSVFSNDTRTFNPVKDECEVSLQPSYKIGKVAYDLKCHLRYNAAKKQYEKQFINDLKHCISSEHSIGDQYMTRAPFLYTSFWPPLHTKKELDYFIKYFFKLPPKMQQRLDTLMKTDLSKSF